MAHSFNDLTATLHYNGQGQLYLYAITLTEQPIYRVTRLLGFALFFRGRDSCSGCCLPKRGGVGAASRRAPAAGAHRHHGVCLPAAVQQLSLLRPRYGPPPAAHFAMAAELSYGQFPVRLTTTTLNGYG